MYANSEFGSSVIVAGDFDQECLCVKFGLGSFDIRVLGAKFSKPVDFVGLNCAIKILFIELTYQSIAFQVN
jgi:hypothetical protein